MIYSSDKVEITVTRSQKYVLGMRHFLKAEKCAPVSLFESVVAAGVAAAAAAASEPASAWSCFRRRRGEE